MSQINSKILEIQKATHYILLDQQHPQNTVIS